MSERTLSPAERARAKGQSQSQVLDTDTGLSEESSRNDETLSLNVVFDALKNERRRLVIKYLQANDGRAELGDIATRIAAEENDKPADTVTYDERKRVYVALYQCHLPKLDDMGIISFNKPRGIMELEAAADQLDPYLDETGSTRQWYKYYGGIVGFGALAVLITGIGGALSNSVALITLVGLMAAVSCCAIAHAWTERS